MILSPFAWAMLVLVALILGISKTGVPGIGILGVVLTVMAIGRENANQGNGLTLILLLTGDVFAVAWYRRHADWSHLVKLLPPAVIGILSAFALASVMKESHLDSILGRLIGGIVLTLLAVNYWWMRRPDNVNRIPTHWSFAVAIGGLAGFATMMSNAAGPLLIIYLLAMRLDKHAFIGTAAWYFLLLNSFKVPFMLKLGWISFESLKVDLILAPVVLLGAVLGLVLFRYIPQRAFRLVVEILTAIAAAKLLVY